MNDLKTRLRTRAYIAATGVFYLLVGIFYGTDRFRLDIAFQPHLVWSCSFMLVGVVSLFAWADKSYRMSCRALYLSGSLAAGFAVASLQQAIAVPDTRFLLGVLVWGYIAGAHLTVARLPDPYLVELFEEEFKAIGEMAKSTTENHRE